MQGIQRERKTRARPSSKGQHRFAFFEVRQESEEKKEIRLPRISQTGHRKTQDKRECNERERERTQTRIDHSEVHEQKKRYR